MKILSSFEIFAEPNWGLPLAIAANLHTPYRIEVGIDEILNIELKDKEGKGKVEKLSAAENFLIFIQFKCKLRPKEAQNISENRVLC